MNARTRENPTVTSLLRIARGDDDHILIQRLRDHNCHPSDKGNGKYLATCPHRVDKTPSLTISIKDDGRVLLWDNGKKGHELEKAVCAALGLPHSCLWPAQMRGKIKGKLPVENVEHHRPDHLPAKYGVDAWRFVESYQYRDADSSLAYEIVRRERQGDKAFLLRRLVGEDEYIYSADACLTDGGRELPAVQLIPFQLDLLTDADPGATVHLFEGERKAEWASKKLGLVATATPFGANGIGKTLEALCDALTGFDVAIHPDNDDAGAEYADAAAKYLVKVANSVRRCPPLPGVGPKGDVVDFINAGGTREQLEQHVAATVPLPKPDLGAEPDANATHLGHATVFAHYSKDRLRWCPPTKRWLSYNGMRWLDDQAGAAMRLAFCECRRWHERATEAQKIGDVNTARAANKVALQLEGKGTLEAMLELSKALLESPALAFDTNPYLFNVQNGTIDLRTGELRPHSPADYITKLAPVEWKGMDAACPLFEECLATWSCGQPDWVRFVQQWAGYCLSGDNNSPLFPIFYGGGGNGKNVFLDVTGAAMGDYTYTTPLGMLSEAASERHQTEIMSLWGKRRVIASESKSGAPLREDLVKAATGDKELTGRYVFSNPVTFTRTHKFIFVTNHLPRITGNDDGIWRRIVQVHWGAKIDNPDERLIDKLKAELPGVLAWMVKGFLDWQSNGFLVPKSVKDDTAEYRQDEDVIAQFLKERCDTSDPNGVTPAKLLYDTYKHWAEANNQRPFGPVNFPKAVKQKGYWKGSVKQAGEVVESYRGIRLREKF